MNGVKIFSHCCKEPIFFCHLLTVILGPSMLPLHTHSVLTLIFVISSYSYRSKASVTPVYCVLILYLMVSPILILDMSSCLLSTVSPLSSSLTCLLCPFLRLQSPVHLSLTVFVSSSLACVLCPYPLSFSCVLIPAF